ncbi:hypothetical protein MLD38_035354 [Melastoma candidum]|uniref:Uncharacterized protein n=1 Tax=Melastoma candidum TaxID=119954 RepID=A0ACB9LGM5_9MYRT|nr:hypothetical protein MLD38_035354 [Melastoma candidum]
MGREEHEEEAEAVKSVYGEDCSVVCRSPPHIRLLIRPRTADVSSQQFVQALLSLRATPIYPDEPPNVYLVESKGLDEDREKRLISRLQDRARQLSSCSMLVAICEEALDLLSAMNHPEGVCLVLVSLGS